MALIPLNKDDYWKATILWQPPCKWNKEDKGVYLNKKYRGEYGIYRFERRHGSQKRSRENLYIGIAFEQIFDERLHQGFHEKKVKHVGSQIWVSVGLIDLKDAKHLRKRYEEIEKILIYFTKPTLNLRKKGWAPEDYFEITNKAYRGPLPKYIRYPVAEVY